MAFLHGIEIKELESSNRNINISSTSVIGLVGTCTVTDAEIPYNKPILVNNVQDILKFGTGQIPLALKSIFRQVNAMVVVIRVQEEIKDDATDIAKTLSNIAGLEEEYTGVYALLNAETTVKQKPKILIAPYYSGIIKNNKANAVVDALQSVAEKLRAIAVIDGTNTNKTDAIDYASNLDSARLYMIDSKYYPTWGSKDDEDYFPLSSTPVVAGIIAKTDVEYGFWYSPSNKSAKGIDELSYPARFSFKDPTADSNLLNEVGVGIWAFIKGSFRLWGQRSLSKKPEDAFLQVRRVIDAIEDALEDNAVDDLAKPFSSTLLESIQSNIQTLLDRMKIQGAILGGQAWVPADINTSQSFMQGQLTVDFDLEPPAGLERLTVRITRNQGYYEELFK